jgi:hypothetical protein
MGTNALREWIRGGAGGSGGGAPLAGRRRRRRGLARGAGLGRGDEREVAPVPQRPPACRRGVAPAGRSIAAAPRAPPPRFRLLLTDPDGGGRGGRGAWRGPEASLLGQQGSRRWGAARRWGRRGREEERGALVVLGRGGTGWRPIRGPSSGVPQVAPHRGAQARLLALVAAHGAAPGLRVDAGRRCGQGRMWRGGARPLAPHGRRQRGRPGWSVHGGHHRRAAPACRTLQHRGQRPAPHAAQQLVLGPARGAVHTLDARCLAYTPARPQCASGCVHGQATAGACSWPGRASAAVLLASGPRGPGSPAHAGGGRGGLQPGGSLFKRGRLEGGGEGDPARPGQAQRSAPSRRPTARASGGPLPPAPRAPGPGSSGGRRPQPHVRRSGRRASPGARGGSGCSGRRCKGRGVVASTQPKLAAGEHHWPGRHMGAVAVVGLLWIGPCG